MAIYNTYFSVLGLQDSLGVLPNLGVLPGLGRLDDLGEYAFSPTSLFLNGEQGVWYDPSDLTPEKVSWRRNLLTYSQDFENAAWTKSNASILSNLALYSQDFDNAAWAKTSSTVTANTAVAPDGTTTADKLVTNSAATAGRIIQTVTVTAVPSVFSVYAKADGWNWLLLTEGAPGGGKEAFFNISTGAVGTVGASTVASVESVGNGWYRCSIAFTAAAGATGYRIYSANADNNINIAGNGVDGALIWGAQLVPGSTAQTYTRSLATAAPIQFADPLGGTLADKLVENTANAQHLMSQTLAVAVGPFVWSAYAKAAERKRFTLRYGTISQGYATFDVLAGTVIATDGTATITSVGSGWYLCTVAIPATSAGSRAHQVYLNTDTGSAAETYTGDGVSGIYVYGAQLEQASTASAYQRITDFSSDFLAAFPTHALYQESTGVTPVTALGQSVGLVLDKRLGALTNLGPELVTNGTFDSGTTGWSAVGAASIAAVNGRLQVTRTGAGSFPRASCTVSGLTAGRSYAIRANFWAYEAINAGVNVSGLFASDSVTNAPYAMRSISGVFVASGTTATVEVVFQATAGAVGSFIEADNISVREVPGNHAIQATSAARPTLQARSNLFIRTEELDTGTWAKLNATVTANVTTAPDGTSTADKIVETTATAEHAVYQIGTAFAGVVCTGSVYIKAAGRNFAQLRYEDVPGTQSFAVNVNLTDGSFTTTIPFGSPTNTAATVTNAGNGWYRVTVTATANTAAFLLAVFPQAVQGTNSYTGDGTSGVFAWGAQLGLGSTATTYQRVTTATDYADVGLPRNLTFDGIDDSLATAGNVDFATWTVGTRRNLLTNPTQFDASSWTQNNSTVTANTVVAPDGTTTADTVTANAGTGFHYVRLVAGPTLTGTYTYSFYVRKNTSTWIFFTINDSFINYFNLDTGQFGTTPDSCVATDVGGGWYRIAATRTLSATGVSCGIGVANSNGGGSFTAVGTESLYAWGAQLEVGSTATAFQDVGTDKVTLFSGVTKLSDAARGVVAELSATAANPGTFYFSAPQTSGFGNYDFASGGSLPFQQATSPSSYPAPITNVLTGLGDIAGDRAILRLNGSVAQTNTADQGTGNYGSYLLYVGRRASTSLPFNGRLFQLVIRGAATDSVTVGNAERWVGQLTGVNL